MKRHWRIAVSALASAGLIAAWAGSIACADPVQGSILSYPAMGNIDLRQGTIEFWLVPLFDPRSEDLLAREYWGTDLVRLQSADDTYFNIIWRVFRGRSGPFSRHHLEGHAFPVNWVTAHPWAQGEPVHLAYCWAGGEDWWIVNGRKQARRRQDRILNVRLNEHHQLVFGSPHHPERFIIDDLRVSSRPRRPDEVGYHFPGKLAPDEWTLLLDPFTAAFECDGFRQTSPVIMTPSLDGSQHGGIPGVACRFVSGIMNSGNSLRL